MRRAERVKRASGAKCNVSLESARSQRGRERNLSTWTSASRARQPLASRKIVSCGLFASGERAHFIRAPPPPLLLLGHNVALSRERKTRASARDLGGYPSNNLDINQLWRAHCRLRTMDIVLFERPTKSNGSHARCACGIQSTRAISGPGPVYARARAREHSRTRARRVPLDCC